MREQIGTEYKSFKFKKYTITIDISTLAACVTKRTLKIFKIYKTYQCCYSVKIRI